MSTRGEHRHELTRIRWKNEFQPCLRALLKPVLTRPAMGVRGQTHAVVQQALGFIYEAAILRVFRSR